MVDLASNNSYAATRRVRPAIFQPGAYIDNNEDRQKIITIPICLFSNLAPLVEIRTDGRRPKRALMAEALIDGGEENSDTTAQEHTFSEVSFEKVALGECQLLYEGSSGMTGSKEQIYDQRLGG